MRELRLALAGTADAVGEARSAVSAFAAGLVPDGRAYELALVVSEIVTNAVRHGPAGGPIEVRAREAEGNLRVEVSDSGPGLAPRPRATDSAAEGGFGLFLVEQLARRWGLVRQGRTTRVWFEFDGGHTR